MEPRTPTFSPKKSPLNIVPSNDSAEQDVIIPIPTDADAVRAIEDTSWFETASTATSQAAPSCASVSSAATSSSETKPVGYDRLSKLIASDNDFLVFRRFGELNVRNILYLQDRLSEITEDLAIEDAKPDTKPGTRRWDNNRKRTELMEKAEDLLRRYSMSN
jgi:hypothetical protein